MYNNSINLWIFALFLKNHFNIFAMQYFLSCIMIHDKRNMRFTNGCSSPLGLQEWFVPLLITGEFITHSKWLRLPMFLINLIVNGYRCWWTLSTPGANHSRCLLMSSLVKSSSNKDIFNNDWIQFQWLTNDISDKLSWVIFKRIKNIFCIISDPYVAGGVTQW